jgi:hypothetical protein
VTDLDVEGCQGSASSAAHHRLNRERKPPYILNARMTLLPFELSNAPLPGKSL